MSEAVNEAVQAGSPPQANPILGYAVGGLVLTILSAVVLAAARSMKPVVIQVHDVDGVPGLYGPGGAEHSWIAVGVVIGLVGLGLLAVAVIAKGVQLGRR